MRSATRAATRPGLDARVGHRGDAALPAGLALEARGPPRRGPDIARVDRAAVRSGEAAMAGTAVRFAPDGRIAGAVGVAGV